MAFFARIDTYRPQGLLAAYLYRIATSKARDRARRLPGDRPRDDLVVLSDPAADPEARAERAEDRAEVRRAVAGLPANQREVILLAEYEGLDYASIARTVGCTLGAVKQRLLRARASLKERLLYRMGTAAVSAGGE